MAEWWTDAAEETERFGRRLGEACRGGELLLVRGELGAGKTTWVRGLAEGLGVDARDVRSPSYTLQHRHQGRLELHHYDVYFTDVFADLERSGLWESLADGAVAVVEWADRFEGEWGDSYVSCSLEHEGPTRRRLTLDARGTVGEALLERFRATVRNPN